MDFLENEVFKKSFVFLFLFISPEPDDVEKRAAYRHKDNFVSFLTVCSTCFYFEYCSHGAEKRHYTFFLHTLYVCGELIFNISSFKKYYL